MVNRALVHQRYGHDVIQHGLEDRAIAVAAMTHHDVAPGSELTLLNLSSSLRYMITGGVLAIAVIVDSLARRSRVSHGRA